jgi:hypothetical protein
LLRRFVNIVLCARRARSACPHHLHFRLEQLQWGGGADVIFAALRLTFASAFLGGLAPPCMGALPVPEAQAPPDIDASRGGSDVTGLPKAPTSNQLVQSDGSTATLPAKRNLCQAIKSCRQLRSYGRSPRGGVVFVSKSPRGRRPETQPPAESPVGELPEAHLPPPSGPSGCQVATRSAA